MEGATKNRDLRVKEIKGVVFLALAVFLLLSLLSYFPQDPSFTRAVPPDGPATHNLIGKAGSYTADSFIRLLGFGAFLPAGSPGLFFQIFSELLFCSG